MTFLTELGENVAGKVDFLYLDAFTDARLNQRAVELAGEHLSETHLVGVGDADTAAGKLTTFMRDAGYITLFAGRVSLYYRGDPERLVITRH
jgi:hypothetical protein